jgi:nucleosome assembly protein 1-like 1
MSSPALWIRPKVRTICGAVNICESRDRPNALGAASDKSKGIEGFWLQALQNQRRISSYIFDHDEEALKFLTNITLEYVDDFQGFKLLFHFAPNPFFDNEVLTKTFNIPDMMGGASGGEPSVESLPGTDIKWKAGKNLTVKVIKKTVKKKGKKTTVSKEEPQDSFFAFFDSPDMESEPENMEEAFEVRKVSQHGCNANCT